jgi:N,N-dimethylformamidase
VGYQILERAKGVVWEGLRVLIGWVSDEYDLALAGVAVDVEREGEVVAQASSGASGALLADLPAGRYVISLARAGFGSKRVVATLGPGQPALRLRLLSDRLIGFVWPRWVRAGEEAELRFHAVEAYRLSLARHGRLVEGLGILGWYDEHGPRAVMQILPDGDFSQAGVAWNRMGYGGDLHHSLMVRAPDRGGLHYVRAEGESGATFAAPWVVAPAAPTAPTAILLSTNTWNAYNLFGGRSNYVNAHGLPPRPPLNARQDLQRFDARATAEWGHPDEAYAPLSFERPEPGNDVPPGTRPEDPIAGRLASSLAPAEWRLLAWLEREGFAHDTYADQQLHDGVLDLDAYRVLVISVHPEYWSRRMLERVRDWLEAGGRLIVLGGNSINCEVEMSDGRSLRFRTQLTSTDGSLGMRDAADPSTWYDSRFHRSAFAEATVTGLATTEAGIMTAAPYRVADGAGRAWVFAGTGLADGDTFGHVTLHERCPGGASGHETDKRSAQTPEGFMLLAKGMNPDGGGAEMVLREGIGRSAQGSVFNVGSITWVPALLIDEAVSRITRNVLERFLG